VVDVADLERERSVPVQEDRRLQHARARSPSE
jgi:hypothetical protein